MFIPISAHAGNDIAHAGNDIVHVHTCVTPAVEDIRSLESSQSLILITSTLDPNTDTQLY